MKTNGNCKITIEIDSSLYLKIIEGKKYLIQEMEDKYHKSISVKDDYFLQWVISDYIRQQSNLPFFNEN